MQYRPLGIKVSCFCPGPMLTRMLLANEFAPGHPALEQALTPQQVADLVTEGIAAERFLIVTRPGSEDVLTEQGDRLRRRDRPGRRPVPRRPAAGRGVTA